MASEILKNHKILLFGNNGDFRAAEAAKKVYEVCNRHNIDVSTTDTDDADFAVCLGGDGTFLDVAGKIGNSNIPILGINTGHLGFLAAFAPEEIEEVFEALCTENQNMCKIQARSVLEISCDDEKISDCPFALNEVAVLKHDISSMISIETYIGGEYLTTYQADGLIIGTPTGSTAYSLSVGGPVIVPELHTIALTPVAPHSLNMRPVVLSGESEIDLTVHSRSGSFLISLDGRSGSFRDNIRLHIKNAPYTVKVITRADQSFYSTLRQKMFWGSDSRR